MTRPLMSNYRKYSAFLLKKRFRLTKCYHVAVKVDIADNIPGSTEVYRHFGLS